MLLVLALRWLAFGWMLVVAVISGQIQRPVEAGAALAATGCWTVWLTLAAVRRTGCVLAVDLGMAIALILVYGHVYPPAAMLTDHPSFMGAYPTAAVAACGVVHRLPGGTAAGALLGLILPFAYAANEVAVTSLSFLQVLTMIEWGLSYVLLGGAVGIAAGQFDVLHRQITRSGEQAARLAERQRLVARIHDDVLQHFARLRARIGELSDGPALSAVAEGLARQEKVLRELALSDPSTSPPGSVSLRDRLAELAERHEELPIRLVASGAIRLSGGVVDEIGAVVAELLTNVVKHAQARQVWLTALHDGEHIVVSVRDDGVGFRPERESDGLGLRLSVHARVAGLAGRTRIRSRPGLGTEVELRVPTAPAVGDGKR